MARIRARASLPDGMLLLAFLPLVSASPRTSPRVVGGVEVTPRFKHEFLAALLRFGRHKCGGALYTSTTVITAAHCTSGQDKDHHVVLHRHNFDVAEQVEGARRFGVVARYRHPRFDPATYRHDIAVWKIRETSVVPSLRLARTEAEGMLTVAGWGATTETSPVSSKLLEVRLPVYDMAACVRDYRRIGDEVFPKNQLCAGFPEGGRDACQGDSGGPLFLPARNASVLVGIVSWGRGCAEPGQPGVYTRVSFYSGWIKRHSRRPH